MDGKKTQETAKATEVETGQGTSRDERGLFECHEEDGEICDARARLTPPVDAAHPEVRKEAPVKDAARSKDERALFDCDADGKNCDA